MKRLFTFLYLFAAMVCSIFISWKHVAFWSFVLSTIVSFICFLGMLLLAKRWRQSEWWKRILIIIGIVVLFFFILSSWTYSSLSGFHSAHCYNLVGENTFTKQTHIYCNYPPWYVRIIGGEEARLILLEDCLERNTIHGCSAYEKPSENDWLEPTRDSSVHN